MINRMSGIILLILICNFLSGDIDQKIEPHFLAVSLGWNCSVARVLRHFNIRYKSFPFDWNVTSFCGLCSLLENNFSDFLTKEILVPSAASFVLNTKYTIGFYHDFPTVRDAKGIDWLAENYLTLLEDIQIKYARRIARFNDLALHQSTVYFFRSASRHTSLDTLPQTRQMVEKLRDILINKFPILDFQLVVLGESQDYKQDWHMDRVQNFYLYDSESIPEWEVILKRVGLI